MNDDKTKMNSNHHNDPDDGAIESLHFEATSHYHANRFDLAANGFNQALHRHSSTRTSCTTNKISNQQTSSTIIHQDKFQVLSKVALEADEALCRFRSCLALGNSADSSSCLTLLTKARKTNAVYTLELEGCLKSFSNCNNNEEWQSWMSPGDGLNTKNYRITKERIDLALAFLVTGVSGFWLHLHHHCDDDASNLNDRIQSRVTLYKAIRLAGCCFIQINNDEYWNFMPTWQESYKIINDIESLLSENGLVPIIQQEIERTSFVMASVRNALNILDLASHSSNNRKRKSVELATSNNDDALSTKVARYGNRSSNDVNSTLDEKNKSNLGLGEIIVKALWHRHEAMHHHALKEDDSLRKFHRQESEKYLTQAIQMDCSITSRRLSAMIGITDNLLEKNSIDSTASRRIVHNLEIISMKCSLASFLLGYVHTKLGDAQKGLDLFLKTLEFSLKNNDKSCTALFEKLILSNISTCYAMLGHPKPCLKLLQQHFSLSDGKKFQEVLVKTRTSMSIYQRDGSINQQWQDISLWQVYFSAILTEDSKACFDSLKQLAKMEKSESVLDIVTSFVYLEFGRIDEASSLDASYEMSHVQDSFTKKICDIARMINHGELIFNSNKKYDLGQLFDWTTHCMKLIEEVVLSTTEISVNGEHMLKMLKACVMNNHAICLIANGNDIEALSLIQKGINTIGALNCRREMDIHYMQAYFNLVLLFIRMGLTKQANKIWRDLGYLGTSNHGDDKNRNRNLLRQCRMLDEKFRIKFGRIDSNCSHKVKDVVSIPKITDVL